MKKQYLLFLLFLLPSFLQAQTMEEWYEKGAQTIRFEEKIHCFSKVLEIDSTEWKAYYNRGRSKAFLKRYQEAILDYDEAIYYNPASYEAYAYRGLAYKQLGKFIKAEADFDRSLELKPGYFLAERSLERLKQNMKMNKEIERKFLVAALPEIANTIHPTRIEQGYLAIDEKGKEVRLRKKGNVYFLTVKSDGGLSRQELETTLNKEQFEILWPGTEGKRLLKDRYLFHENGLTVEVDVYHKRLEGLIIAEVEFSTVEEAQAFEPFKWMGEEVTENPQYKNKNLWK